jgi:hypothetical protein
MRFLGHLAIPPCLLPRFSLAGCGLYLAGKGSDSICPTMAPESRRVIYKVVGDVKWNIA